VISLILFYIKLKEIKRDNQERRDMARSQSESDVGMQVSVDHSEKK
jgi:hypothetical protein